MPITYSPSKAIQVEEIMFAQGSYVGDGALEKEITGLGFAPDAVTIWGGTAFPPFSIIMWSTKISQSDEMDVIAGTGIEDFAFGSAINAYGSDGFTVGTAHGALNNDGVVYYYEVWKA